MATSAQLEELRRTLLEVQNQKKELVSVNAGLMEEKGKILKALQLERSMRKNLKKEIIQSEAKWQKKVATLEDQVRSERAAKEEISEIEEELERMSRETEAEWDRKEAQMKEDMKILQQQNKFLKARQSERSELNGFNGSIREENKSKRQAWQDEVNILKLKNKDLTMKTEDLTMKNKDLTMKTEDLTMKNKDLTMKTEDLMMKTEDLTMKNEDLTIKNNDLTMKYKDLTMKNEYLMKKNKDMTIKIKDLMESDRLWEKSLIVKTQQEVVELKIALEAYDKQLSRVVVEKDDLKTEMSEYVAKLEKKAQMEEDMKILQQQNIKLSLSLTELQKKNRETEKEWHLKVTQREEDVENLTRKNTELRVLQLSLQELAQKTDKEKAKMRRKEKKAEKEELQRQRKEKEEMEKRDKKERKEEAEREKKMRKENEKREKEELKRLKKEGKEKRDKKGRKEELNSPPITLTR
ncbi:trichohyalin-like [Etheostoma spectabile]|uniref:trichohyalin-like n=1 Tax=Etheostoma spectabile TaxID=54343 RepID=UPI0013AE9CE4|nr:trichohyalin-like [Etheostoma spectabile]